MRMERDFAGTKAISFINPKLAYSLQPQAGDLRKNVRLQLST